MVEKEFKIVFIHHEANMAGSAISLFQLISCFELKKYTPILILPSVGPAYDFFLKLNIKILICPIISFYTFPGPRTFSRGFINQIIAFLPNFKLRRLITTINPKIVHINDKAGLQVGISLIGTKIKIIQHIRSSYKHTNSKLGIFLSSKIIRLYADHLIIISEDEEDGFISFKNKNIIYNTVDLNRSKNSILASVKLKQSLGYNKKDFIIGFASAHNESKGYFDFIEIAKEINQGFPDIKFLILGSPSSQTEHPAIESLKLNNIFNFTGYTANNIEYIACMDILLVPNKNGVLGRQPIEAQSVSVPVIAYKGSRETKIINNKSTGFLCESKEEMLRLTRSLILDIDLINTLKLNCVEHSNEHFDKVKMYKKVVSIYLKK